MMIEKIRRKMGNLRRMVRRRGRGKEEARIEAGGSVEMRRDDGKISEEMMKQRRTAVELFTLIGRMKTTKRTGWVERGVPRPESVADHSYRMVCERRRVGCRCA